MRAEVGDLPAVGAAFAAGDVSSAHVEVAVRAHKDLGGTVRNVLVDCEVPKDDADPDGELRAALAGLSDAFTVRVRQVRVVDTMLAHYARRHAVPEFEVIARRIVGTLNPPDAKGAHERRFLFMSPLPNGEWRGRFSCGPAQGLLIKRALAAFSAPRPGRAIDQDGVEHTIPDLRDLGARQMDAATDIVTLALAKTDITLPTGPPISPNRATVPRPGPTPATEPSSADDAPTGEGNDEGNDEIWEDSEAPLDEFLDEPTTGEPPPGEGEPVVIREPGVLAAPYPSVDLVLIAGVEHVAAAWAHRPDSLPVDLEEDFSRWLRDRFRRRSRKGDESTAERPAEQQPAEGRPAEQRPAEQRLAGEQSTGESPPPESAEESRAEERTPEEPPADRRPADEMPFDRRCEPDEDDAARPERPGWLRRVLSPYAVPARLEHAGAVDATTLELLACTATVRAALLAPSGALLDLGRAQRLATPAQKTALLARDGGCVIPGCTVPGDACDAHHVTWWIHGGRTDLDNLALVCGRHHTEVHHETWEIRMLDGIPWVVPPRWVDPEQRLLRNAAHHPTNHRRDDW